MSPIKSLMPGGNGVVTVLSKCQPPTSRVFSDNQGLGDQGGPGGTRLPADVGHCSQGSGLS